MVAVGRPLELFDVPVPRVGERDVLVRVKAAGITRTALILVGRVFAEGHAFTESRLYAPDHHHVLRPKARSPQQP